MMDFFLEEAVELISCTFYTLSMLAILLSSIAVFCFGIAGFFKLIVRYYEFSNRTHRTYP